jgi:formylglycine-generating enzyme required for sulfatase activity
MKNFISIVILFTLTACAPKQVPTVPPEPTSTSVPRIVTTIVMPATATQPIVPTIVSIDTAVVTATSSPINQRFSPIDGMPQVFIPAGKFRMGGMDARSAPDERPAHYVEMHAYWMDQLEVTNAMYLLCIKRGGCTSPQSFKSQRRQKYFNNPEFNDYPVIYITWGQANAFCTWAGERLPSEAEWERAARGDDWRTFPWGEDKANGLLANYNMIVGDTSRVGTYPLGASPFGVLDMAGNVAEWTNDFYGGNIYASLDGATNPTGPETTSSYMRVVRGGSLGDAEINIRVPKRSSVLGSNLDAPVGSVSYLGEFSPRIGFRCVADQ